MQPEPTILGYLIRPQNGARMPIHEFIGGDGIRVAGQYMNFETSIRSAIHNGYLLEGATEALQAAWEAARAKDGEAANI